MSAPESWEEEQDREDSRARQQQQQNPRAPTFQPGAQSFTPGQQYQQYQQYNQNFGGYPQYGQQGYGQQFQQYGQYNQGYGQQQQYGYQQQQYQQYNQGSYPQQQYQQYQQQQQNQAPVIAKRGNDIPAGNQQAQGGAPAPKKDISGTAAGMKTLSISAETAKPKAASAPKVEKAEGGAKVLSIGLPSSDSKPAEKSEKAEKAGASDAPGAGKAAAASKAISKTGETPGQSGRNSPTPSGGRTSPTGANAKGDGKGGDGQQADKIAQEQEADVDESVLNDMYGKELVNVIFLGHVDAGKSTLGGSILVATGNVDERTLDKYRRDAKEAGRETWYLSWALDLTKEERAKGKTVEVGRGFFETDKRRYAILDAPGHKTFVPNMIGGASQADIGILVISARKGEYETGFEKGGQTREHAILAKAQGVNKLIVVVNKMDDPSVEWSQDRYKECTGKLQLFLKGLGYNPKTDLMFMPVSAQTGLGIKDPVPKKVAPWNSSPALLEYLDGMQTLERKVKAPFMMPIAAKYRELGTVVEGKIESGVIQRDAKLLMMPNKAEVQVQALYGETEDEINNAMCGEQIRIKLRNIEEEDILQGFVLCSPKRPVHCVSAFEAQIVLLDLKSILSAGFNCVMHVHSATEEVQFAALLHKLEKGTGRKSKKAPGFATKGMSIIARLEVTGTAGSVCLERFEDYPQMGRFTLRDSGVTIAIGKVTKLITDTPAS